MPRPVSIRASYRDDASHLLRLEAAIAKDGRQTRVWRVGTTKILRKLALRFLEADARMNMGSQDVDVSSRRGSDLGAGRRRSGAS